MSSGVQVQIQFLVRISQKMYTGLKILCHCPNPSRLEASMPKSVQLSYVRLEFVYGLIYPVHFPSHMIL
jgi:hypothetical protein